jgi:hypothetical protein
MVPTREEHQNAPTDRPISYPIPEEDKYNSKQKQHTQYAKTDVMGAAE